MDNKNISRIIYITIILAFIIVLFTIQAKPKIKDVIQLQQADTTAWIAPKTAEALKNPIAGNLKEAQEGKKLFNTYCVTCHGENGKGNGITAESLNPKPADLTLKRTQKQTDGAIFWKITTGRPPMVSWKNTLTDKQRWMLVDYIRELAKK